MCPRAFRFIEMIIPSQFGIVIYLSNIPKRLKGALQNAKQVRKPWLYRRGGPCALPADQSSYSKEIFGEFVQSANSPNIFSRQYSVLPGGGEPLPYGGDWAMRLFCNSPFGPSFSFHMRSFGVRGLLMNRRGPQGFSPARHTVTALSNRRVKLSKAVLSPSRACISSRTPASSKRPL